MRNKIPKEEKFNILSINKMFEVAGHDVTFDDVMEHEKMLNAIDVNSADPEKERGKEWYELYTWNKQQEETFKKWFIETYCKTFKKNKKKGPESGENIFNKWNLQLGLTRNDLNEVYDK